MVRITKQGCFFWGNKISLKVKHKTVIVDKQKTRVVRLQIINAYKDHEIAYGFGGTSGRNVSLH
jgi:hypothetical protein